ncbi:glycosyltransferase [Vibrio fluvialis]|uniref:glycosyltransferase n=1 Tax=Vibrio fluvialis TaxID=676 RepID=UPI00192A91C2|nr:glycosyltransferase [Vibrio fluvialis]MBL4305216.1 glycosyltransferase [Vibrio fluvialis]
MSREKIYITSKFFLPNIGGVENSLKELASALSEEFDVIIYTTNINNVSELELPLRENINGYEVIRVNCSHSNKYIRELKFYSKMILSLRKESKTSCIIARDHFSVINAWLSGFRNISYLVPGVVKYQNSKQNHGAGKNKFLVSIESLVQKLSFNLTKNIFVFSDNMKRQVLDVAPNLNNNLKICKPGVNPDIFSIPAKAEVRELRTRYNIPENKYIILGMARFVKAKGYSNLVDAFKYLSDDFLLVLVGDGPERDSYVEKIQTNNMHNVILLGPTSNPCDFYKMSDLFAMTSIYEPLGQTILESQVSGIPNCYHKLTDKIITASNEVIYKDYSFEIKDNSPKHIAEAIFHARENKSDELSEKMSQYLKDNFSWYKLGKKLIGDSND